MKLILETLKICVAFALAIVLVPILTAFAVVSAALKSLVHVWSK